MTEDGTSVKVINVEPRTNDELKRVLETAQKDDRIAILHDDKTKVEWMEQTSDKEKITLINCSFLKTDDIKVIFSNCKEIIEDKPPLQIETITNLGEPQAITVISSSPTTLEELRRLIKLASAENLRVRCVGTEHSWASICSDKTNLLIYMKNIESDYENGFRIRDSPDIANAVDIMPGVTPDEIKKFQTKAGLMYSANFILDVVKMVSGAAAVCPDLGKDLKAPSDYVVKIRILDAKGKLNTFKSGDNALCKAIQTNFGCFGVIYDMTIEMPPTFLFITSHQFGKLKDVFYDTDKIKTIFDENWLVEMFWFPFNSKMCHDAYEPGDDEVLIKLMNKSQEGFPVAAMLFDIERTTQLLPKEPTLMMSPFKAEKPSLTPLISWSDFGIIKQIISPTEPRQISRSDRLHLKQYLDMAPVYDMEFAFDFKSYSQVQDITDVVVKKVCQYEKKGEYPLNIALQMRMGGYSNALLCPSSIGSPKYQGSGRVLCVNILSVVDTDGWQKFCIELALEWMKLGGVPNLAKQWDFIPGIEKHIYKVMYCQIAEFKSQLKESECDPEGIFLNKSLQNLFQL